MVHTGSVSRCLVWSSDSARRVNKHRFTTFCFLNTTLNNHNYLAVRNGRKWIVYTHRHELSRLPLTSKTRSSLFTSTVEASSVPTRVSRVEDFPTGKGRSHSDQWCVQITPGPSTRSEVYIPLFRVRVIVQ